ncbi:fibronectin type III domain-containing protein [Modestobacter sp. VKM Ac-2978]|uniref:fibronectin type III domain-containing protein n=1 Tax=Modestobacter sp. VKM Ac-2978 TaxID=3004132 RepID=UPI0022AB209F|nr:fibronectin type III domain-containing protein [Modestobacter sp. VKM Ac-2978]MCZ2847141.1 fibronectin type III domain-containing protein [Modestobacter sp. VKM Ac-2978]
MTRLRRGVLLVAVVVATVLGVTATAAQAAFDDSASLSASVGTATVAPPTKVTTSDTWCFIWFSTRVSWAPSTSPDVIGYRITTQAAGGGSTVVAETGATTTSTSVSGYQTNRSYTFTVTALTRYGWTAVSAQTGTVRC